VIVLIRRADIENPKVLSVQRPENLVDISGHLLKPLFTCAQGLLCLLPPGNVTKHGHVPAWKVVRLRRVFYKNLLAIAPQNPRFSMLPPAIEKTNPCVLEISHTCENFSIG